MVLGVRVEWGGTQGTAGALRSQQLAAAALAAPAGGGLARAGFNPHFASHPNLQSALLQQQAAQQQAAQALALQQQQRQQLQQQQVC